MRCLLPFDRIVAYYGNLYSKQMGILGQYPPAQVLQMLASTTEEWQAARYLRLPLYRRSTMSWSPHRHHRGRTAIIACECAEPVDQILAMAAQVNGIVFLDVQIGQAVYNRKSPCLNRTSNCRRCHSLARSGVRDAQRAKPGTAIGTMDATDINYAANYLGKHRSGK